MWIRGGSKLRKTCGKLFLKVLSQLLRNDLVHANVIQIHGFGQRDELAITRSVIRRGRTLRLFVVGQPLLNSPCTANNNQTSDSGCKPAENRQKSEQWGNQHPMFWIVRPNDIRDQDEQ